MDRSEARQTPGSRTPRARALARLGLSVALLLASATSAAPADPRPTQAIAACLRQARCPDTFVVAHRALGFGAPENSVEAIERAIGAGLRMVKIDLRASRDGQVFVLHDPTLDRTTNRRGRIAEQGALDLRDVRLANGEPLPRFEDVHQRFRDRVVFVVDCKVDVIEAVADRVAQHGSLDDVIFLVAFADHMRSAARARERLPGLIVAARLQALAELPVLGEIFRRPPEIIHTDLTGQADLADLRRRVGDAKLFVKALDAERRIQPFRYFAIESILAARPEMILTDQPQMFQRRLQEVVGR